MLQFVRNAYHVCTTIVIWIVLVASVVSGGIGGYVLGSMIGLLGYHTLLVTAGIILGIALGGAAGILFIVLFFGAAAIILNMDKNIAEQNRLLAQLTAQLSAQPPARTAADYPHTAGVPHARQDTAIYTAVTKTLLKASPEPGGQTRKVLNAGETVSFIRMSGDNPKWFYAKTFDSAEGWCFVSHFRRITSG